MKKLLTVLAVILAINFLAVAGGAGWLWRGGHLDREKVKQVRLVLFPPPAPPATRPKLQATTEPVSALGQLLDKQSGRAVSEQVQFAQKTFDAELLEIDRRRRELDDLKRQVDLAHEKLAADRDALENEKKALAQKEQEASRLQTDKGFQDSLALYQALPSKQVKTIFMGLSDQTVMQYLQAMQPRDAGRIIKEFKTPDELAFIQKVLEMMRSAAAATTNPSLPSASAAGK